jgi:hypothetical protein
VYHRYELRQTSRSRPAAPENHGGCLHYIEGGYAFLFIIEAYLVVRKNVHQHVGTLLAQTP